MEVTFEDNIAIVNIGNGQNRLNISYLKEFHKALNEVESNEDAAGLIVTASGKFFSNGIDLDVVFSQPQRMPEFWDCFNGLLLRILTFPMPTVAAINGHAFAGGCLVTMAFDYRVMNSEKGWMSMNEVYLPSRFPEFLVCYMREVVPNTCYKEFAALGRRYTAEDAKQAGLVHRTTPLSRVIQEAKDIIAERLKYGVLGRDIMFSLKSDMYVDLIAKFKKVAFYPDQVILKPKL